MTDIKKLIALFTEFGIGFTTGTTHEGYDLITCEEGSAKIDGYSGFVATFEFDENGKFKVMGVGE